MNPILDLYNKANNAKQNGIKVLSVDYVIKQIESEQEYYRLKPREAI